jgi:hypothetical protein
MFLRRGTTQEGPCKLIKWVGEVDWSKELGVDPKGWGKKGVVDPQVVPRMRSRSIAKSIAGRCVGTDGLVDSQIDPGGGGLVNPPGRPQREEEKKGLIEF